VSLGPAFLGVAFHAAPPATVRNYLRILEG
jgi:hypothetical protein